MYNNLYKSLSALKELGLGTEKLEENLKEITLSLLGYFEQSTLDDTEREYCIDPGFVADVKQFFLTTPQNVI